MKLTNKAMLITYPDSLGNNLSDLKEVLNKYMNGVVGGLHILPFFPSSADRGFAPKDYTKVENKFGDWNDIDELSKSYYLMFDFMINHISKHSKYFVNFQENHNNSPYKDMFINWDEFWKHQNPKQSDIDLIYKRKPKEPIQEIHFKAGKVERVWNTFGEEQIDLDITKPVTQKFIKNTLDFLMNHGASIIRLDAFAYAIKKIGTTDFFVEPDIWKVLNEIKKVVEPQGVKLLPEIHENYHIVRKLTDHDYYSYDFALPIIVLYSLYSGKVDPLIDWLKNSPMKQFTTLDTHDGIGVVDGKGILTNRELDFTKKEMYKIGANVKKVYSSTAYNNLDIYQINTTYYSALGNDDKSYLIARAIQIFAPGIPQIYYVGLLAGKNDINLLEKTKEGRNINRHYYSKEEIKENTNRLVVKNLFRILRFRNDSKAFDLNGSINVTKINENNFTIVRSSQDNKVTASLVVNLKDKHLKITNTENQTILDL